MSGGAIGVDKAAEAWCNDMEFALHRFPVSKEEWNKFGKAAGPMRNKKMAEFADGAIIIHDGESRGTKNMIEQMKRLDKPVYVKTLTVKRFVEFFA